MTENDWDEATEVTHVSKPDTIPCPPPTEPAHEPPAPRAPQIGAPVCLVCGAGLIWDTGIRYYVCDNPKCERRE